MIVERGYNQSFILNIDEERLNVIVYSKGIEKKASNLNLKLSLLAKNNCDNLFITPLKVLSNNTFERNVEKLIFEIKNHAEIQDDIILKKDFKLNLAYEYILNKIRENNKLLMSSALNTYNTSDAAIWLEENLYFNKVLSNDDLLTELNGLLKKLDDLNEKFISLRNEKVNEDYKDSVENFNEDKEFERISLILLKYEELKCNNEISDYFLYDPKFLSYEEKEEIYDRMLGFKLSYDNSNAFDKPDLLLSLKSEIDGEKKKFTNNFIVNRIFQKPKIDGYNEKELELIKEEIILTESKIKKIETISDYYNTVSF